MTDEEKVKMMRNEVDDIKTNLTSCSSMLGDTITGAVIGLVILLVAKVVAQLGLTQEQNDRVTAVIQSYSIALQEILHK